ncbi:MAG: hypothetical protein ACREP7_06490 [Lysobacter sp.]
MELVSRFVVGGGYRVPVGGRSTVSSSITTEAIAGAVGYMPDALSRHVAIAVATRGNTRDRMTSSRAAHGLSRSQRQEAARIAALAYLHVLRTIRRAGEARALDLKSGADRWRIRIVIYDAAVELIWPEQRRSYRQLAKVAKMRVSTYCRLYRCAAHVLESALSSGRSDFARRLFALSVNEC